MLVEFSIENFRSIKDRVTLSMVASSETNHSENVFRDSSGKFNLLKSAAIYGANASGKSNIIKAFQVMRKFVLLSHKQQRGDKIEVVPFKLDSLSASQPSKLEAVFVKDGIQFIYGFSANEERIYEEWLKEIELDAGRRVTRNLFHRTLSKEGVYLWRFGEYWKPKIHNLENQTLENALYLSLAVKSNHNKASIVFDWFKNTFKSISSEPEDASEKDFTARLCNKVPDVKSKVQLMLKDADLGIEDFVCEEELLTKSRQWQKFSEQIRNQILKDLGTKIDEVTGPPEIKTKHLIPNSEIPILFDMEEESKGTQRLFSLAGPIIHSMIEGNIIFCDELDSSLHPLLTKAIVDMIQNFIQKPVQFIFTTHDSSLLDADIFRRDQIWFTEKNKEFATDLYSLWDIKPRKEDNYRKGYLNGRYGAIPFIGDFDFDE